MNNLEKSWKELMVKVEGLFDQEVSLKGILFLIGIQELKMLDRDFSKEEKVDVLHVAVCTVLAPYGYYKLKGVDEDGWIHYNELRAVKSLSDFDQKKLIKKGIINYFTKN